MAHSYQYMLKKSRGRVTTQRQQPRPPQIEEIVFPRRVHPLTGEEVVPELRLRFNVNLGRDRMRFDSETLTLAREEREWREWSASLENNGHEPTAPSAPKLK